MSEIWKDTETLSQWYQVCAPDRPPTAEEYVDFDGWVDDGDSDGPIKGLRGTPFVQQALGVIKLSRGRGQSSQLMTGFRGTGKTTELNRLAVALRAEGFAVVQADARRFDNFTRPHTIEDLTMVLAAAIGSAEGADHLLRGESVFKRILNLLQSRVSATSSSANLAGLQVEFELKNADFRTRVRELFENDLTELRAWFHQLVAELRLAYAPRPLAILVDGLEKYDSADPAEVVEAYRSATAIYENFADWLKLPEVHVVYCVPPLFATMGHALRARYDHIHPPLASIRIHRRPPTGVVCEAGYEALEVAIAKRVNLTRLFGDEKEACTRELIQQSGGHIRDLFGLLRLAIVQTLSLNRGLTVKDIQSILAFQFGAFALPANQGRVLQAVAQTGTVAVDDFAAVARVFDDYLVFSYANGEQWFDLSPRGKHQLRLMNAHRAP